MKNKKLSTKKKVASFQKDLNDLLLKYDISPEDGRLHLLTSKINFNAINVLDCPPQCQMTRVVTLPNGQTTILRFCDPKCQ